MNRTEKRMKSKNSPPQEHKFFPTYVLSFDLSNLDVSDLINSYEGEDHTLVSSGSSSHSKFSNVLDKFPLIGEKCQECIKTYGQIMKLKKIFISNSWVNKMTQGGKTKLHRHEGSVLSGAFYLKSNDDSAGLVFHSPLKPYRMNDIFYEDNPLDVHTKCVPAQQGMLYLFPSWLEHETEINQSSERYVLSFNTWRGT